MASIREAPCNKELFSKINLGILKIFLVLSKIHLGSKFLAARDSPPVRSAATRQVADKGSTPPKKQKNWPLRGATHVSPFLIRGTPVWVPVGAGVPCLSGPWTEFSSEKQATH